MDILEKNNAKFSEIRYSPEFKDMVCREFLKGDVSKGFLERKYNLGHGRVVLWMRRLGYIAKAPTPFVMSQNQKTPDETSTNQRIKELEKELENARLQAEAYRLMIEVAERELQIKIRKK